MILPSEPAPRRPVDPAFSRGCNALRFEGSDGGRFRQAVEGHINERRVAACCRSSGSCGKTLPFRSARLIDVDVRIDQAWQQHAITEVMHLRLCRDLRRIDDGSNLSLFDQDGAPAHALGRNHPTR